MKNDKIINAFNKVYGMDYTHNLSLALNEARADERAKMIKEGYDKIYTHKQAMEELKRLSKERMNFQDIVIKQEQSKVKPLIDLLKDILKEYTHYQNDPDKSHLFDILDDQQIEDALAEYKKASE